MRSIRYCHSATVNLHTIAIHDWDRNDRVATDLLNVKRDLIIHGISHLTGTM